MYQGNYRETQSVFSGHPKNFWVAIFVISGWVVEFNYKCPFNTGWQQ